MTAPLSVRLNCGHRSTPAGFSGVLATPEPGTSPPGTQAELTARLSCGCSEPVTSRLDLAPFTVAYPQTLTWCDPRAGIVARGPLAAIPVFYTELPSGQARFSTRLADLIGAGTQPHEGVVAAMLTGRAAPAPLTPYRGVFRLPAGAALSLAGGRARVSFADFDWKELIPPRPSGTLVAAVGQAIETAIAESGADAVAASGGVASMALSATALRAGLATVHVDSGVPVLTQRRGLLPGHVEVADGTPAWFAALDAARPPSPEQCDPWPGCTGRSRVLSGHGLVEVLGQAGSPAGPRSRWARGWQRLSADLADPALLGRPWWHAWRSQVEPGHHGHDDAGSRWLTDVVHKHTVTVLGGAVPSHLLPAHGDAPPPLRAAISPVVALADAAGMTRYDRSGIGDYPGGTPPAALVIAALHPAVAGVALLLSGSERSRWVDGTRYDAQPLRELAGRDFVMADVPAVARDRMYAAAFVRHRLARRGATAALADQVRHSSWVDHLQFEEAIGNEAFRLRHSLALHRLIAAAAHYPGALLAGTPEKE
jgi:hypothetical protein